MNARVLHYTFDRGSLLFKSMFVYLLYIKDYIWMLVLLRKHIVSCIVIIESVRVLPIIHVVYI